MLFIKKLWLLETYSIGSAFYSQAYNIRYFIT
jgi:hypothetical protein